MNKLNMHFIFPEGKIGNPIPVKLVEVNNLKKELEVYVDVVDYEHHATFEEPGVIAEWLRSGRIRGIMLELVKELEL